MNIHQWDVWKARPPGFASDHWFVIISGQERCVSERVVSVNGLACFTMRGRLGATDVQLDAVDGFAAPTCCQCDYFYQLEKHLVHSGQGMVSWERQQQIKSKIKELLRL